MTSGRDLLRSFFRSAPAFVLIMIAIWLIAIWSISLASPGQSHSNAAETLLRGDAAISSLKERGQYDSFREALTAARRAARHDVEGVPGSLAQEAYLKASNAGADDSFGSSIAASGETVVVGATNESSNATGINGNGANDSAFFSGAAYVFVRSGGVWSQQAYLKASNTGTADSFGHSVAISGETIVVGAPYEDSSATGVNGNGLNNASRDSGAAYVFVRTGATWSQQAYLKASNTGTGDRFGYSVAVSGDTVLVGADSEDSSATGVNGAAADNTALESGAGYVFTRTSAVWSQQAYLKASNTASGDGFGWSSSISGDTVVVGAPFEDSAATGVNGQATSNEAESSGAAYVFVRSGATWSQQAYLKASNTETNDLFGYSIAISVDTIVSGAVNEDGGETGVNGSSSSNSAMDSGAVFVFFRSGSAWSQQAYIKASNTGENDFFGHSVAIFGDLIGVGAPFEYSGATGVNGNGGDNSTPDAGAAYQFQRTGSVWTQGAYLKAQSTGAGDRFGYSVAVSSRVFVGAVGEDSAATGVNGNQSDDSAPDSGAAYIFTEGAQQPLSFSVAGSTITAGSTGTASLVYFSRSNENTMALSLTFDPTRLTYVSGTIGVGVPPGSSLMIDSTEATSGRVGVTISLPDGQSLTFGTHQLCVLTLTALSNAQLGATLIGFGDSPVPRAVIRADSSSIPISLIGFNPGIVTVVAPIPVRNVRAVGSTIQTGTTGQVTVEIDAIGTENALAFSLTFDSIRLSFSSATPGSGAPGASLNVNSSEVANGRLGIRFDLPAGQALQSGARLVVIVSLSAIQGAPAGPTPLGFGDTPVARELVDISGTPLPAAFSNGTVTIELQGFEADTSPRPSGNGAVSLIDWVQTGRFAVGLDTTSSASEFQRADCAPKDTKGNGVLSLADWVQAGRYGAGLDPVVSVGGPTGPVPLTEAGSVTLSGVTSQRRNPVETRTVTAIVSTMSRRGLADVAVWIDASGAENAISFSLFLDPNQWELVSVQSGRDVTSATLIVNRAMPDRIGIALALPPGQSLFGGWRTLVEIKLKPRLQGQQPGLRWAEDGPVAPEVVDVFGNAVSSKWTVQGRQTSPVLREE